MAQIAGALGAQVQGDDGEVYRGDEALDMDLDDAMRAPHARQRS